MVRVSRVRAKVSDRVRAKIRVRVRGKRRVRGAEVKLGLGLGLFRA
jgi:hypothetical protein